MTHEEKSDIQTLERQGFKVAYSEVTECVLKCGRFGSTPKYHTVSLEVRSGLVVFKGLKRDKSPQN